MRFDDKVVAIAGVGREGQVGEAVARAFADRGASLLLIDRDVARARDRAAALSGVAAGVLALGADLADAAGTAEAMRRAESFMKSGLDALVHLAGGFATSGPVAESEPAVWDHMFAINLKTAVNTSRAFLPALRVRRGAIVYFASEAALPGARTAQISAYAAAKGAVVALMRAVAHEERSHGVRANALAPGTIRTAANEAAMGAGERYVERAEVAAAVLWLASEQSSAVTGQLIRLSSRAP
ncbi:MAG TPA: SDR family oxidoreductase [Gemmatimonadaceae bacterium]|nr:SDR family oxidoreductase [Gemmatimonadaceae bacterium]